MCIQYGNHVLMLSSWSVHRHGISEIFLTTGSSAWSQRNTYITDPIHSNCKSELPSPRNQVSICSTKKVTQAVQKLISCGSVGDTAVAEYACQHGVASAAKSVHLKAAEKCYGVSIRCRHCIHEPTACSCNPQNRLLPSLQNFPGFNFCAWKITWVFNFHGYLHAKYFSNGLYLLFSLCLPHPPSSSSPSLHSLTVSPPRLSLSLYCTCYFPPSSCRVVKPVFISGRH